MAAIVRGGPIDWSMSIDDEGHRDYTIAFLVECTSKSDGPAVVANAVGLPQVGSYWSFGNDIDGWAFRLPGLSIRRLDSPSNEPGVFWRVECKYSTKPRTKRCQDNKIEDPLLEPPKISGTFTKLTKQAQTDRHGRAIKSSSHEPITGNVVEFQDSRPTVRIQHNVPQLQLPLICGMIDHVNASPLWGLPKRTILLTQVSWERQIYGTCNYYYTRTFEFEIDYKTTDKNGNIIGFDREIIDSGSKALHGRWNGNTWELLPIAGSPPNKNNPGHFTAYRDRSGNLTRCFLDGSGKPITNEQDIVTKVLEYYPEADFLQLGIPTSL